MRLNPRYMAEEKTVDCDPKRSSESEGLAGSGLLQWIYGCLFNLGLLVASPYYFRRMTRRGQWRDRVGQRFGRYNPDFIASCNQGERIWLHAVSVGEVNLSLRLVQRAQEQLRNCRIMVSTTTTTGMGELKKKLPSDTDTCFYPIDRRSWVRRALDVIRPKAIILSEAEVWPNLCWEAERRHIPIFLINARISEKSFVRYRRMRCLFRPIFQSMAGVGCQNTSDAERLQALGCQPGRIRVTGNMKFDAALTETGKPTLDVPQWLADHGISHTQNVLLGSSTHPGEEAILGEIFASLMGSQPDLRMIIVPRHFERAHEAGRDLESKGLKVAYRSEWHPGHALPRMPDCLILNSTGELASLYPHVDVVFIGKSLCARGGQSPIEAAAAGKAMVMGPHMQNFRAITQTFLAQAAAIQIQDRGSLSEALTLLLKDTKKRLTLGDNARKVVDQNLGAVDRSLEMLLSHPSLDQHCVER
jgi:3-deoxy-D-manno-octulosonic-acid transferase